MWIRIICAGSTLDKVQFFPLDQIQKLPGLIPMKMTKVYVLLTGRTKNRYTAIATLEQKINKLQGSNNDAIVTIL